MRRSPRRAQPLLLLALFALSLVSQSSSAPPSGVPLWLPGDPDPTYPFSDRYPVVIVAADEAAARTLAVSGIDVESVGLVDRQWTVQANINAREHQEIAAGGHEVHRLRNLALETARSLPEGERDWTNWPTFPQFEAAMQAVAAANPSICRLVSVGQTVQGRNIWFMKITDNPDLEEDEPEFRYSSSMHGDEVTGMEMCWRLINYLVNNYGTEPTITQYVNEIEIWICPLHNPDGYVAGSRYNANGVDLNRNFPDPITDPNDNPIGRQPETQAFMYLGYDHRFVLSANYHGGALVVNYPWDSHAAYTPDDATIRNFSLGYSFRNPPMWNSPVFPNGVIIGWQWYIVNGGLQDWCYHWRSDIDVTIEVSNTKWPAYSQMDTFWANNRDAMLWYMGRSLVGIRGRVTDAQTGQPLSATVAVTQINKTIRTDPDVGDYQRLLLPGTYTLQVSAFGYLTATIPGIVVVDGPATRVNVALERPPTYQLSGRVTRQGSGLPLSASVKIYLAATQQLVAETTTNPADGSYSVQLVGETYEIRVAAQGHIPETRQIVLTGNRIEDFALADAAEWILVIRDGATTRIASDLQALGMQVISENASTSDPSTWGGYRLLIWSAGANLDPVAIPAHRDALEAHVAAGRGLLIEGGQIGYDTFRNPSYPSFGANVLKCSGWDTSNAGNLTLAASGHALVTTPNALPTTYAINYAGAGDNDAVRPLPEATLVYRTNAFPNDAGILAYDDTPGEPSRGQTVFYAFNYNALSDQVGARRLLENTVAYLNRTNPAEVSESATADIAWIGPAYPNPAIGLVRFRLAPRGQSAEAEIIDIQGRRVWAEILRPSDSESQIFEWDGRTVLGHAAPTGIYFVRIESSGDVFGRRFLWMRR